MTDRPDRDPEGARDPLERELRRSLAARAQDAPDADALTDRLLAAGAAGPAGVTPLHRRGWHTWGTPLVAAACVVAIVGIVLVIVRPGQSDGGPDAVATPSLPLPVSSTVSAAPSAATSAPTSASPTSTGGTTGLSDVHVIDLTFVNENTGWALGSSDCVSGPGRCTALLRTTDGTDWTPFADTSPFQVSGVDGCPAATCVDHLRFATSRIGYAYGPDALFRTTDGAQSWTKQTGGAVALETVNDDVIRLSTHGSALTVSTADLGSTTWTTRSLPGVPAGAAGFALARTSSAAYVVSLATATGDPASTLWASTNDGQTWTERGPACGTVGDVGTGDGVAVAPDGAVALACSSAAGATTVAIGTRAGLSLQRIAPVPRAGDATPFVAAASRTTVLAGTTRLFRSTDAGSTWTARAAVDVSGGVTFAGFESTSVGRLVTDDGRTVWTTRDAGATWTAVGF